MNIPNSVTIIGGSTFEGCRGLTSVTIPNSVTSIGGGAFAYCSGLTSVTIPNSVTSIGGGAFEKCTGLTSVHIIDIAAWCKISFSNESSNPLSFAHHLYQNGEEIKNLIIPDTVTSIGSLAFIDFDGLYSVTIGNSVTSIEKWAFCGCDNLTSISIGNSLTIIQETAFIHCSSLSSVHITDLEAWCKISFGDNPLSYAHHLFLNGEEIKDLIIPNSVTSIGYDTFRYLSNLTSVTIPNSVTSIGSSAFLDCKGLTSVISKMENPCYIGEYCFDQDVFYNTTLYVPKSTIEKYKSTYYWNRFVFIEEGEPGSSTLPEEKKCATPSISYANKKLTFSCATEGVEYHYTITDADIKSAVASSIDLSATYEISVYATKSGYTNSDVATATLVWTDAVFTETTPSASSAKAITESIPMLISAQNSTITVRGEQNGLPLTVYTADGKMLGSATMKDGLASIYTNLQRGEIAIVKVGSKSVKIKM